MCAVLFFVASSLDPKRKSTLKCSHCLRPSVFSSLFSICSLCQSIVSVSSFFTANKSYKCGDIMEKMIVYLKLFQIVLTLTIFWQLISLHQFCGTFADPKTFLFEIRVGNCERYTLIGKDAETGEFGDAFRHHKWHNQFIMNRSANAPQHQFFYFLVEKLPPAGRHCIPITISPFDWIFEWIGMLNRNPLNNGTLFLFSKLFFFALCSLGLLGYCIMKMLRSMEEYKIDIYLFAFASVIGWGYSVVHSFNLLFYWTDFWTCVNFQADHTNVQLITFVLSIVLVCSSIFEIVLHKFVLNDVDTECANMSIHQQQQKKNGSACCAIG